MPRMYISVLNRMASYSLLEEVWAAPQARPITRETSHLVSENADLLVREPEIADAPKPPPSKDNMTDCQTRIQQLEMEIERLRQMLSSALPRADRGDGRLDMTRNDLMFYVASGVFTLFLLDSFLNAGLKHRA